MMEQRIFSAGRKIGWFAAAALDMTLNIKTLRADVDKHHWEAKNFLAAEQSAATEMQRDAMRHSYVSARMAQKHGDSYGAFMGFANEAIRDIANSNTPHDRGMDLHNNGIGRLVGLSREWEPDELMRHLWSMTIDGTLITDPENDPRAVSHSYGRENHLLGSLFETSKNFCATAYGLIKQPVKMLGY